MPGGRLPQSKVKSLWVGRTWGGKCLADRLGQYVHTKLACAVAAVMALRRCLSPCLVLGDMDVK